MTASATPVSSEEALRARIRELEAELARVTAERDKLRKAYEALRTDLDLLRRRIFLAKAERVDTRQLELEFAAKKAELAKLAHDLGLPPDARGEPGSTAGASDNKDKKGKKPSGRRDLRELPIPEERCEILDPALEATAERIGFEETVKLGYRRGGPVRIVVAKAKYKVVGAEGATSFASVPEVPEVLRRCMADASLLAHILYAKFRTGLPLFRQEAAFATCGVPIDRGTMSRWAEDVGANLGFIVEAARVEALAKSFCLATDATGIAVQPTPLADGRRQACRKGHFFVTLADHDHVFFDYQPKHTSAAVCSMFRGFQGYVQADAHSVYDALFRGDGERDPPTEVGCWSHARRRFYEAAVAKHREGLEGVMRIGMLFELERGWAHLPPARRTVARAAKAKPLVEAFFAWAESEYARVREERGCLAAAFGYVVRQRDALSRFVEDGRLKLENNAAERALRTVAVGRKNWLFCGSDDHAQSAANILSLLASCKLHGLDGEAYLRDVLRVFAHWPRDRYLELAPKYWLATRGRLDATELARPLGPLTVPPPLPAEQ